MKLVSAESITRPEVLRWHDRFKNRYTPPEGIKVSVFLPCSARKPYSKSKSHMNFKSHIRSGSKEKYSLIHEVIVTSPLGLVPRELEEVYPAAHYDVPVTGKWVFEEKQIVLDLMRAYMENTDTPIIGYGDGTYSEMYNEAGMKTVVSDLNQLEEEVKNVLQDVDGRVYLDKKFRKARATCDFQFGKGASNHLFKKNDRIKGLQVTSERGELVATFDRYSGFLALGFEGAVRLFPFGRYWAELSFKPDTSSIFTVGIEKADPIIRPKDEVIVTYDDKIVGVGKAQLSGEEMKRSNKGLGIMLRHRRD